jgi:hypothetical protein
VNKASLAMTTVPGCCTKTKVSERVVAVVIDEGPCVSKWLVIVCYWYGVCVCMYV